MGTAHQQVQEAQPERGLWGRRRAVRTGEAWVSGSTQVSRDSQTKPWTSQTGAAAMNPPLPVDSSEGWLCPEDLTRTTRHPRSLSWETEESHFKKKKKKVTKFWQLKPQIVRCWRDLRVKLNPSRWKMKARRMDKTVFFHRLELCLLFYLAQKVLEVIQDRFSSPQILQGSRLF